MRFWIDVANSPHATLFAPIVRELSLHGHNTLITVWDRAQTEELARSFWPELEVVGGGNEPGLVAKGLRIGRRAMALASTVRGRGADLALGHNSYAQLLAAWRLRIPAVTMMDFEHQPANHLAFRLAAAVLVPDPFPQAAVRRFGAAGKLIRYRGFKEEITLAGFRPDPAFRSTLGVGEREVLVSSRPPPDGALYHRRQNPLFEEAIRRAAEAGAAVLVSPRGPDQACRFGAIPGVRLLERSVDGANLMSHSDLVIGAGGTMTREAALLGTPSYSLFAGPVPAVDRALIAARLLIRVTGRDDLSSIAIRQKTTPTRTIPEDTLHQVVGLLEETAEQVCGR